MFIARVTVVGIAVTGCGSSLSDARAVGSWHHMGSCRPAVGPPANIMVRDTKMRALANTSAQMHCADGPRRVHFRTVSKLTIDPPRRMNPTDQAVITVRAFDHHGNELRIGQSDLEWSVTGPLEAGPRCNPLLDTCLADTSIRIIARATGKGRVSIKMGPVATETVIDVE